MSHAVPLLWALIAVYGCRAAALEQASQPASAVNNLHRFFHSRVAVAKGGVGQFNVVPGAAHPEAIALEESLTDSVITWDLFRAAYARLDKAVGPMDPHEVHLALTGDNSEMRVMWVTHDAYVGNATARWGPTGTVMAHSAAGTSRTYTVPKRWWPIFDGYIHEVVLKNLVSLLVPTPRYYQTPF